MKREWALRLAASTVLFLALAQGTSVVADAQQQETRLQEIRASSLALLQEPKYENQPHYLLICIGKQPDSGRWLVTDGAGVVYFDRDGDGDLTDKSERIESLEVKKLPPGSDWDEERVFKIGDVGQVALTLRLKVRTSSFGLRPTANEQRKRLRELQVKYAWQMGSLQTMAGDAAQQNLTFLFLSTAPQDAQVVWIEGELCLRLLQELVGQEPVFDLRKRIRPGSVAVRVGTVGLPVKEAPLPSFTPADPSRIPKHIFPQATIRFQSETVTFVLSQRIGGGAFRGQFQWPVKVALPSAQVRVTFNNWVQEKIEPLVREMKIEF